MTITAALGNALSGLTANARMTDVISGNLANALTPGHAPRTLELQARRDGGGVAVLGVTRILDPVLLGDRRLADSALADAAARAEFATALARVLPPPGEPGSLSDRLTRFEASLVTATARPEEDMRLAAVTEAAGALTTALQEASGRIATLRSRADAEIAEAVETLNSGLARVAQLNTRIVAARGSGQPTAPLEDLRQQEIDALADLLPLRQLDRANGTVALVTTGGALLLDGRPTRIGFEPTPLVTAQMSLGNGQISGLSLDGRAIPSATDGPLGGGRIGALFDNRDRLGPEAQAALDGIARDLITRVEALTPPPAAGLFTEAGARLDPVGPAGLAGRIALTAAVDPARGGALFRLRSGPEATVPDAPGTAPYLVALAGALSAPLAASVAGVPRPLAATLAEAESAIARSRLAADRERSFAASQTEELRSLELAGGVDSDAELQRLLRVEQAFSANARMIRTIDEMMQTLLRI